MTVDPGRTDTSQIAERAGAILDQVELAVVGKRPTLEMILLAILADGHVLLEDFPGLAKTLMARSFAQVMALDFSRVQFTPDLMPMDVTGSALPDGVSADLRFRPGPIFTNLLLADEVNRAPPKTQAALLEAMEERQVTSDGVTRPLARPFVVIATQNPIEYEGTYPLPEAQLDRFLTRVSVGYPTAEAEFEMLQRRMQRTTDALHLDVVVDGPGLRSMQAAVERVHVAEPVGRYIVSLVAATRQHPNVYVGASPRGSLAVMKLSRARALVAGRDFVTPDDVKAVAVAGLAHRVILRPELWVRDVRAEDVVLDVLAATPAPAPPPVQA
jgi:MoxR-like ATPase